MRVHARSGKPRRTPEQWGKIGGETRAQNMTAAERRAVAKKAAKARWAKVRKVKP